MDNLDFMNINYEEYGNSKAKSRTATYYSSEKFHKQQNKILSRVNSKLKDTKNAMKTYQAGIKLNDENLEYHRWNLSAQKRFEELLLEFKKDLGNKE